ncbi:hypothetical protein B0O80DRAFT_146943 [Mortierella sp. GBAus27b]|nr:hypothetical protein B0O80DRAFT_146943 [Mortierella sp. GBAus27b]
MEYRRIWIREHDGRSLDGLPQLLRWLHLQIQYALFLVMVYRTKIMGSKPLTEYWNQLLTEIHHHRDSTTTYMPSTVMIMYAYATDCILYGVVVIWVELTLIYTDLTACGFSRDALSKHFAEVELETLLQVSFGQAAEPAKESSQSSLPNGEHY